MSEEKLRKDLASYTKEIYDKGHQGLVDFLTQNTLSDRDGNLLYKCTDINRRNFILKNKDNDIIFDHDAEKLKAAIKPVIDPKLIEYKRKDCMDNETNEQLDKCLATYNDNKKFGSEFNIALAKNTYIKGGKAKKKVDPIITFDDTTRKVSEEDFYSAFSDPEYNSEDYSENEEN